MISLIATVYNEEKNIKSWLDSLATQTRKPDEIIIVDGGSSDRTWDILREESNHNSSLHVFRERCNISKGRNIAIGHANGDIIIATDAGCVYAPEWFERLAEVIEHKDVAFATTAFGPHIRRDSAFMTYLLAAATTPAPYEFKRDWLPSSRSVAFSKRLWKKVGGYPEWIPICEDIIFDIKIGHQNVKTEYIREPLIFWEPRPSFGAYMKQLFRYTRSDGHGKLWSLRHAVRYTTYLVSATLIMVSFIYSPWFLLPIVFGGVFYMRKFWKRWAVYSSQLSFTKRAVGAVALVGVIFLGDIAKMCGWPLGVFDRLRGKIVFESY